ncbi:hypothetical protein D1224_05755 [Henriciella barbarensis]|uniref:Uncharacterized protein n=1 Tax=Henriciella barbarensis TaxID=86342 RepID=A0A399R0D9_9PROT|nr:hypothetical protein [Henriciella barbarensis]RIJ23765.1 hypothetical protein D1224_05755 [Henriciella barbarensis]
MSAGAGDLRADWLAGDLGAKSRRKVYWRSALEACGDRTPVLLFGDSIFAGEIEFSRCSDGVPAVFLPVFFSELGLNRLFEVGEKPLFAIFGGSPDDGDAVDALIELAAAKSGTRFALQDSGPHPLTPETLQALMSARLGRLVDAGLSGLVLTSPTASGVMERFDWSRPLCKGGPSANDVTLDVARERRVPSFDLAGLMRQLATSVGGEALFQPDGVHLSLAGRLVLLGAVYKGLTGEVPVLDGLARELAKGWSEAGTGEKVSASELPGFARLVRDALARQG